MKLKFKTQQYQTDAVKAVVDCFAGQPYGGGLSYTRDLGQGNVTFFDDVGFRNTDIALTGEQVLKNIQTLQRSAHLPVSERLAKTTASPFNLDIEMETGTGKTYCYIKTIFELNKQYGWSKFIIVVPSIAIREGVYKSLQITADHFMESYGKKARFFMYNSKQLDNLNSFSTDSSIQVMVMNMQAFNAKGADNRRIYEELDDFGSRKPIDVIASNRPILILDEPQKMEGKATTEALPKFKPLFVLRYSATHKTQHNLIHRLDALDAYNQKLVKKIHVKGLTVKGLSGMNRYIYLEHIEVSKQAPVACIEIERKLKSGDIKRERRRVKVGDNLFDLSNGMEQYKGFMVAQIDGHKDEIEFTNTQIIKVGEALGDITESLQYRLQIRETIKSHLDKEQALFAKGVKVLSLFFIDEVVGYRDYGVENTKGVYAQWFEEEYEDLKQEYLQTLDLENPSYHAYLQGITTDKTHEGYFSIDKKSKQLKNPDVKKRGDDEGLSDDIEAYDLILKNKERLLSFDEPVRFIFSHSALREGWDNPNVFNICMLKHSDNTISRRQEVGRGLRLAVNQQGERMDNPQTVHHINILTVVASESYEAFVGGLQKEMSETLAARPQTADEAYFMGKFLANAHTGEQIVIDKPAARQIYQYLVKQGYVDDENRITSTYHTDSENGTVAELPEALTHYGADVLKMIDTLALNKIPEYVNERGLKQNKLNDNFYKDEFQKLWGAINQKTIYQVDFDSDELVQQCIQALNKNLRVTRLQYNIKSGLQAKGFDFEVKDSKTEVYKGTVASSVRFDPIKTISEGANLIRLTVVRILSGIRPDVFELFKHNPEQFMTQATFLINEQKALKTVEKVSYDLTSGRYETDIFTVNTDKLDLSRTTGRTLKKHIYDYVMTDSQVERTFSDSLEASHEVVVYGKLPRGFFIPTPVGNYNPDWAIAFHEGTIKHIYFVAETKGSLSTLELKGMEKAKTECAEKFFQHLNQTVDGHKVKYGVVKDYETLMQKVIAA